MSEKIHNVLRGVRSGSVPVGRAMKIFKDLPYKDLGFAKVDHHRTLRRGFPEVIFGQGKTPEQIIKIARRMLAHDGAVLITRTNKEVFNKLKKICPKAVFEQKARIIYIRKKEPALKSGTVLVITAGTSDIPVAEEARVTLEMMGNKTAVLYDVGVAGLHRVLDKKKALDSASVIIVVAGMEGALASVVSGLVSRPVIAVPTSVGYGASFAGIAPLLTMMNSCSPGVAVVNIDNGFGAAYFASMINK